MRRPTVRLPSVMSLGPSTFRCSNVWINRAHFLPTMRYHNLRISGKSYRDVPTYVTCIPSAPNIPVNMASVFSAAWLRSSDSSAVAAIFISASW